MWRTASCWKLHRIFSCCCGTTVFPLARPFSSCSLLSFPTQSPSLLSKLCNHMLSEVQPVISAVFHSLLIWSQIFHPHNCNLWTWGSAETAREGKILLQVFPLGTDCVEKTKLLLGSFSAHVPTLVQTTPGTPVGSKRQTAFVQLGRVKLNIWKLR